MRPRAGYQRSEKYLAFRDPNWWEFELHQSHQWGQYESRSPHAFNYATWYPVYRTLDYNCQLVFCKSSDFRNLERIQERALQCKELIQSHIRNF